MHVELRYKENTEVIILAGARDFGRSPLASRLPTALWPVMGRPVIELLLENLKQQGLKKATELKSFFIETSALRNINVQDTFKIIGIGLFFKHLEEQH